MTAHAKITFRQIKVDDTHVVWLAEANRFVQFKEPAFFVFGQWADGTDLAAIARACTEKYDLPLAEAERFAGEIIGETEKLYNTRQGEGNMETGDGNKETGDGRQSLPRSLSKSLPRAVAPSSSHSLASSLPRPVAPSPRRYLVPPSPHNSVTQFTCCIYGKNILFTCAEPELEDLFRPLFRQFEVANFAVRFNGRNQNNDKKGSTRMDFFLQDRNYAFRLNDREPQIFGADDTGHFQGAVLLEILNILHHKTQDDWMAVFHASAVSLGDKALLFAADSGGGKSTLAALLTAHGCRLVSDDFVPVSIDFKKVFPLPTAISVKKGSLPVLEKFFPLLRQLQNEWDGESELFLSLPEERIEWSPVAAKAIVFVRFDPFAGFSLTRESNLEMMNILLQQSWIPGTPESAGSFLEWYFSLQVYSLAYSDFQKMVKGIKRILAGENDL